MLRRRGERVLGHPAEIVIDVDPYRARVPGVEPDEDRDAVVVDRVEGQVGGRRPTCPTTGAQRRSVAPAAARRSASRRARDP